MMLLDLHHSGRAEAATLEIEETKKFFFFFAETAACTVRLTSTLATQSLEGVDYAKRMKSYSAFVDGG